MFDNLKANEEVQKAIVVFTKTAIYGTIIIGAMLFLQKLIGFTFDFKVGLGL